MEFYLVTSETLTSVDNLKSASAHFVLGDQVGLYRIYKTNKGLLWCKWLTFSGHYFILTNACHFKCLCFSSMLRFGIPFRISFKCIPSSWSWQQLVNLKSYISNASTLLCIYVNHNFTSYIVLSFTVPPKGVGKNHEKLRFCFWICKALS